MRRALSWGIAAFSGLTALGLGFSCMAHVDPLTDSEVGCVFDCLAPADCPYDPGCWERVEPDEN